MESNGIFCIETNWETKVPRTWYSVEPVLRLVQQSELPFVHCIHQNVWTKRDFESRLKIWSKGLRARFPILYVAGHGIKGAVWLKHGKSGKVTLGEISNAIGPDCSDAVIYISGCNVLAESKSRREFVRDSGVAALMGFSGQPDWSEGVVTDFLILNGLARKRINRRAIETVANEAAAFLVSRRKSSSAGFVVQQINHRRASKRP